MTIKPVKPDPQDFKAIERQYGRPPYNATDAEFAHHYRRAQAAKLIRMWHSARTKADKDAIAQKTRVTAQVGCGMTQLMRPLFGAVFWGMCRS